MARRRITAAAVLTAAAALLVIGQLCNATQSEAEEFWGTILPNSPIPDAVLKILHPDINSVNQAKDVGAKRPGWLSRLVPSGDNTPDENMRHLSRLIPFFYSEHTRLSSLPSGDENTPDENTGHLSRLIPFFYSGHTRPSLVPSSGDNTPDENTGHLSRLIPFFYSEHTRPSSVPSGDDSTPDENTGHLSRLIPFFYSGHTRPSPVPSGDDNTPEENTGHLSRLIPFFYSGHTRPSPVPSGDDNKPDENMGHLSRLIPFFYSRHTLSSLVLSGDDNTPDENMGHLSRLIPFFYSEHTRPSPVPSGDDNTPDGNTDLSRLIPFFYSGYRRSSPVPSNNDNAGGQQLTRSPLFNHDKASHKHSSQRTSIDAAVLSVLHFFEEALQVGKNITMYFPPAVTAPLGLLPHSVADSIPFSKSSLLGLLARLGIAVDSVQAAYMQVTLDMCTSPSHGENTHFCATSLEALVEGAIASLGSSDIRPVTSALSSAGAPLQPYSIRGVRPVEGPSFVGCHDMDYPYSVYMCHSTGPARVYMVDMEDAGGDMATVAAVCHTDTSKWDPEHLSFKILGSKPGGAPICHTVPYGNIIWAKNVVVSAGDQTA